MSAVAAPVAEATPPAASASRPSLLPAARALAPLLAAALAFAVAASIVAPYPVGIFHDDGVYLILAKSIANGDGYRYLHLPGAPIATHYPPIYPIFLALLWAIGSSLSWNLTMLLLANAALLAFATWAFARFVHQTLGWSPLAAATLALAGTLSLPLLQLTSLVMSEVLFFALLIPLLAACERGVLRERRRARLFALGAMIGALALVRMHGVVLTLVVGCSFALRREWRRAAFVLAGAVVVLAPWQLWVAMHASDLPLALHGSYGSYLGWFADGVKDGGLSLIVRTVSHNVAEIAALVGDRFAPWAPGFWRVPAVLIAVGCAILGAVRLHRRIPITIGFTCLYFLVTLLWPYAPWRFVWGVWPLVLLLVVDGAVAIASWKPAALPSVVRLVPLGAVAALAIGAAGAELTAYRTHAWSSPMREATRRIAPEIRWIAANARPHETVLADAEPLVYLWTQRRAVPPVAFTATEYIRPRMLAADTAALSELVRLSAARYVVTMVPTTIAAARALAVPAAGRGFVLRPADALDGGAVFEVVRQ